MTGVGPLVDRVVHAASAVRGERIIHAKGRTFHGELTLLPAVDELGVPLARGARARPVLVRFSRGAGLPDSLPDVLGMRPVRSEIVWLLVSLDKDYANSGTDEPWPQWYADRVIDHFTPSA